MADEPSANDLARAIALVTAGLITDVQFLAVTGRTIDHIDSILSTQGMLIRVQRSMLTLQNSGALARLEAARHAREAVEIAASIMRDSDNHPSTRLNAATFVAKASGTQRPPTDAIDSRERHTITINVGDGRRPIVVTSEPVRSVEVPGDNRLSDPP
jgi:transcription initiation factor TFIID subunit TAF12